MSDTPAEVEADSDAPDVEVDNTTVEAPDAVVEASPTIVVESGESDGSESGEDLDHALEVERRLTALEHETRELWSAVAPLEQEVATQTAVQEATVEAVVDQAEEQDALEDAVTEEVEQSLSEDESEGIGEVLSQEDDEAPTTARRHWLFRSRDEWRNK